MSKYRCRHNGGFTIKRKWSTWGIIVWLLMSLMIGFIFALAAPGFAGIFKLNVCSEFLTISGDCKNFIIATFIIVTGFLSSVVLIVGLGDKKICNQCDAEIKD